MSFHINQKVKVYREEVFSPIKVGIVVGITDSFLRVYDPEKDPLSYASEWFPIKSKKGWIVAMN